MGELQHGGVTTWGSCDVGELAGCGGVAVWESFGVGLLGFGVKESCGVWKFQVGVGEWHFLLFPQFLRFSQKTEYFKFSLRPNRLSLQ